MVAISVQNLETIQFPAAVRAAEAGLQQATLHNSVWYLDRLITFLAIGDETEGRFALLRVTGLQGAVEPAHSHASDDENLYVLEGELTVAAGDEAFYAHRGDMVSIPRGVNHAVRHDTPTVTYLQQFSPAGFERYFHEMSEAAEYLGPPPHPVPLDRDRIVATAARYGCLFTGPVP
jgi:quercetin dioxygenase-like cupin family protein